MTVITFLFTMVGAVGERYRTIAFGTLVKCCGIPPPLIRRIILQAGLSIL